MINFSIEELVPRFLLRDKNGYALAKAIEAALNYYVKAVKQGLETIDDVASMPEWRLDEMAWELGATWYDYTADVETKRNMIGGAEEYYNRLGTPSAVQRIINDVFGEGTIQEWFEYGGKPYHYQVNTTNNATIAENRLKFMALLDKVANVRSVLDNIYYYGKDTARTHIATRAAGEVRSEKVAARATQTD